MSAGCLSAGLRRYSQWSQTVIAPGTWDLRSAQARVNGNGGDGAAGAKSKLPWVREVTSSPAVECSSLLWTDRPSPRRRMLNLMPLGHLGAVSKKQRNPESHWRALLLPGLTRLHQGPTRKSSPELHRGPRSLVSLLVSLLVLLSRLQCLSLAAVGEPSVVRARSHAVPGLQGSPRVSQCAGL
jgi:hypothetical protein